MKSLTKNNFILYVIAILISFGFLLFSYSEVDAQPRAQINYQGKLLASTSVAVADGTYNMRFWLLQSTAQATTSAIWTESLTGTNRVQVTNGLFSVMLGSTSALTSVDFNQELYLGVEIGGTNAGFPTWDGEMSPRKELGTVPAAFEAFQLGGVASSSFVRSDEADTIAATTASTLLTITQSGAGDILNLFDDTTEVFTVEGGGYVGIGTTSPASLLDVWGDVRVGTSSTPTLFVDTSANRVGIGTASPEDILHVYNSRTILANTSVSSGNVNSSESLALRDERAFATNVGGGLTFQGKFNTAGNYSTFGWLRGFKENSTDGGFEGGLIMSTRGGDIVFKTQATSLVLDDRTTGQSMIITDSGEVGIGDSSPAALFTVGNGDRFQVDTAGRLLLPAGASGAGNLSLAKVADTDTGFYFSAADELRIQTGGSDRLTINASGYIGIGSTSPNTLFSVEAAEDTALIALGDSTNSDQVNLYTGTTSPEGRVSAPIGSLFMDSQNGLLYQKTGDDNGNTSWGVFSVGTTTHTAQLVRATATSVPDNSVVRLDFDTEVFDQGGIADVSTDRITVKRAGKYLLHFNMATPGVFDGSERIEVSIRQNGSNVVRDRKTPISGTNVQLLVEMNQIVEASAGDYFELYLEQNEGAAWDTQTLTTHRPSFSVTEVGRVQNTGGNSIFTDAGSNSYVTDEADNILIGTSSNSGAGKFVIEQQNAADIVNIFDGATEVFTILDGGNVGIGTTSPASRLDVWGSFRVGTSSSPIFAVDTEADQIMIGTSTPFATDTRRFYLENTEMTFRNTSAPTQSTTLTLDTSGNLNLNTSSAANQRFNVGGTRILSINSSGVIFNENNAAAPDFKIESDTLSNLFVADSGLERIGIATTTPWKRFSVSGDMVLTGALFDSLASAGTNGYVLQTTGSGVQWVATSSLGITGGGSSLFTDGGGTTYLTSLTDNLGIGSSTGSAKLTVQGDSGDTTPLFAVASSTGRNAFTIGSNGAVKVHQLTPKLITTYEPGTLDNAIDIDVIGDTAYVAALANGLQIVDITDPYNPSVIGYFDDGGNASNVFVQGKYAYVADFNGGLEIIDISVPSSTASSTEVGSWTTTDDVYDVYVSGNYAYVTIQDGGLSVLDVSDPANPIELGNYDDGGTADFYRVVVSGDYAYVARFSADIEVINISDPYNPTYVRNISMTGSINDLQVVGNLLYTVYDVGNGGVIVTDISDPNNPVILDTFSAPVDADSTGIFVSGDYAYVGTSDVGLYTVDISSSTNVTYVGASGPNAGYIGKPFVVGNYVYAADFYGLEIYELGGFSAPSAEIGTLLATQIQTDYLHVSKLLSLDGGLNVGGDAKIDGELAVGEAVTINQGLLSLHATWTDADIFIGSPEGIVVADDFAYIAGAGSDSIAIIDVSDPSAPTTTGNVFPSGVDYPDDVELIGDILYTVAGNSETISAIDVSDPTNPTFMSSFDPNDTNILAAPGSFEIRGNYAYVTSNGSPYHVGVFDISDPYNIKFVSKWDAGGIADGPSEIDIVGDYAYVTGLYADNMVILDISNPASTTLVGEWGDGAPIIEDPSSVVVSGKYAYVIGRTSDNLAIVDISDPANPTTTTYYDPGVSVLDGPRDVFVAGNYAYVTGANTNNVIAVDISDPANPTTARVWNASTADINEPNDIVIYGNHAYITGFTSNSIAILDLGGLTVPTAEIGNLLANDIHTDFLRVSQLLTIDGGLNVAGDVLIDGELAVKERINVTQGSIVGVGSITDTAALELSGASDVEVVGDYAFVVSQVDDGIQSFNISNPANPVSVGSTTDGANSATRLNGAYEIKIVGKYAYVISTTDGLQILDISDPTNMVGIGGVSDGEKGVSMDDARDIEVVGNYAYVTGYNDSAVQVIDISDPTNPFGVDTHVIAEGVWRLAIAGDYAYVTSVDFNSMQIVDISDPHNLVSLGSTSDGVGGSTEMAGATDVAVSGSYAYVTGNTDDGVQVIDVSDPNNPVGVGSITDTTNLELAGASNIEISGRYLYVTGNTDDGVQVIDISSSTNPVGVASITDGAAGADELNGARGISVVGNFAYVAGNVDSGLQILDLGGLTAPTAEIGNLLANDIHTDFLRVSQLLTIDGGLNVGGDVLIDGELAVREGVNITQGNLLGVGSITDGVNGGDILDGAHDLAIVGDNLYVATFFDDGLQVIDISDPTNPTGIGSTTDQVSGNTELFTSIDVAVHGDYAYVVGHIADGIQILDISNPSNPVSVGKVENGVTPGVDILDNPRFIEIQGNYAYVSVGNSAGGEGFQVIDISDPAHPIGVGSTTDGYGSTNLLDPWDLDVVGNYAYIAVAGADGVQILDISDPTAPTTTAFIADGTNGATTLASSSDIVVRGNYAYVTSYIDDGLQILDISDPANPTGVGAITDGTSGADTLDGARRIALSGNYAYVTSNTENGVQVIDISDPANPVGVDSITDGERGADELQGALDILIQGNYAYVSGNSDDGIQVLDLGGLTAPTAEIGNLLATDVETSYLKVTQLLTVYGGLNVGGDVLIGGELAVTGTTSVSNLVASSTIRIVGGDTFPTSPSEGTIFFKTDEKKLYTYASSTWRSERNTEAVIVAASDSPNAERADYQADGTADQTEINNAISSLGGSGGVVYLLEGTYNISGQITLATSTNLIGAGETTVLRLVNSHNTTINMVYSNSHGMNISSLKIDGNKANQSSGTMVGIYYDRYAATSTIDNVVVTGWRNEGMRLGNVSSGGNGPFLVNNSWINNNGNGGGNDAGIRVGYTGFDFYGNSTRFVNNQIENNNPAGIHDEGSKKLQFIGNAFNNNTTYGLDLQDGEDMQVLGNTFYNNGTGIDIVYSYQTTISNNFFEGNNTYGMRITNGYTTVSNNQFVQTDGTAIYGAEFFNTTITNNVIDMQTNSDYGMYFAGIYECSVDGNSFGLSSAHATSALVIAGFSEHTSISDNNFSGSIGTAATGYGIEITSSNVVGIQISGNVFDPAKIPNRILDNGTGTIYNQDDRRNFATRDEVDWELFDVTGSSSLAAFAVQQLGTGRIASFLNSSGNIAMTILNGGDVGVGTSTPNKRFQVLETVSDDQFRISYDQTRYTDFQVDSSGDLTIDVQGGDMSLLDENLFVCAGGSCPSGSPAAQGTIVAETAVGIGSSTPFAALAIGADGAIVTTEKNVSDAGTITIDWRDGNQQLIRLAASRTVNFTGYLPGQTLRLVVCTTVSSRTVTWGTTIRWSGGSAPTQTATANKCDVFSFIATIEHTGTDVEIFGSSNTNF